jgi:hypothetical protein
VTEHIPSVDSNDLIEPLRGSIKSLEELHLSHSGDVAGIVKSVAEKESTPGSTALSKTHGNLCARIIAINSPICVTLRKHRQNPTTLYDSYNCGIRRCAKAILKMAKDKNGSTGRENKGFRGTTATLSDLLC